MKKKSLIPAAALFTLTSLLVACGGEEKKADTAKAPAPATLLEKDQLTIGFIKLTDMAPLAIAKEKGYFEAEGLYVTLQAQANWKVVLDRVVGGELDGSFMLAGQPLAATVGLGTKSEMVVPYVMDLNGNAITVSNEVWSKMSAKLSKDAEGKFVHPISAAALKPVVAGYKDKGKSVTMAMTFPMSTHNYELRYWLAAGGIKPGFYSAEDASGTKDAEVLLSVTPPPQMPSTMEAGTIMGYCVGEPWNQQAVTKGVGVPVITSPEIWNGRAEKVFGITKAFADANPNTVKALTKALIRAGVWLDSGNGANRTEAVRILSKPEYVGADSAVIANSMTGTFEYSKGDKRPAPDFNIFHARNANYPFYSDAVWYLTQMRRWGQIGENKSDAWYDSTAKKVFAPAIWQAAAAELVKEGKLSAADVPSTDGYKPATNAFLDSVLYDPKAPNAYLKSLTIGLK